MNLPEQIEVGTTSQIVTPSSASGMQSFIAATVQDSDVENLFAACMPRLARTARRLVRNTEDSEDLLQETMLSAFKNLHQFEGRAKFSTWLHSIVRNKAKMHLRKSGTHRCCSLEEVTNEHGELLLDIAPAVDPDAEEACLGNERSEILRRILLRLSPGHRVVIQLCDIEGLDGRAAAARLGLTISGLKTRLHRARKCVAKKIAEGLAQEQRKSESPSRFAMGRAAMPGRLAPAGAANAPTLVAAPSRAERRDDQAASAPLNGRPFEIVRGRRAVGVRHERAKRSRDYYCLPMEHRVGACNVSGAV
jgi:RNA polymerase sigma-70 factor (ECF subfamily)